MKNDAGLHIMMDARVADPEVFTASNLVAIFAEVVEALDMKALDEVKVYEVPVDPKILERVKQTGNFEDEGGISTIQVISTSHISLHAWPLQSYFALDAFSCKDFDAHRALEILRSRLGIVSENTLIVKRRKPDENSAIQNVQVYEV